MYEEDNIAVRLKTFIDEINLTNSQFADHCGIPRPSLSQILTGRNKKISDVIVGMIHRAFPQLNVVWLMFGEGDMLIPQTSAAENADENPEINPAAQDGEKYRKEIGLENTQNQPQSRINSQFLPNIGVAQNASKKVKNDENPRKVVQITVYYDDNSYETFYPKK